ncbi:MAG: flagellar biosynthetic protein FliO [Phycisphaerales bacterium JB064]
MAARLSACVMIAALALCAGVSRAQVGPPVETVAPAAHAQIEPEAVKPDRLAESDMPLMAPAPRDASDGGAPATGKSGWARSLASVALVVGLILVLAAAARFLSRRSGSLAAMMGPGGRAPSGVLEVLARYPVGRGQVMVLLRIDRRVLLLSQTVGGKSAGFTTLAQFDDPSEVAAILRQTRDEASESMSVRFRQALERFQGGESEVERGEIIEVGPRGEPLPKGRGVWA